MVATCLKESLDMFEEPGLVPGSNLVQLSRLTTVDQVASHHHRLKDHNQVDLVVIGKGSHRLPNWMFLDTHVSLAPTHLSLSVRDTFEFPFYQCLWSLYVKSWRERTPTIFQFWVWVRFPETGRGGGGAGRGSKIFFWRHKNVLS